MTTLAARLLEAFEGPHTLNLPENLKSFLVRVQLAHSQNYDDLHDAMLDQGFERTVVARNGEVKQLPEATYFLSGQPDYLSAEAVHDQVKKAIKLHKTRTEQSNITAQTFVSAVSDVWFDLGDADD
ncbi:hypothetical protein [Pseudomonas sp. FW300-N2A2]|uniref:hypothetical protein n=1 Tax=Pseudomonas sp. FW300-N2A2 TaxID=2751316 RepID=UPI001A915242|nr:hypothetical protein [Pseudomonas sp. FW300-N2A2]